MDTPTATPKTVRRVLQRECGRCGHVQRYPIEKLHSRIACERCGCWLLPQRAPGRS